VDGPEENQGTERYVEKMHDLAAHLESKEEKFEVFKISRHMVKDNQEITGVNCMRTLLEHITTDEKQLKNHR
jgi:hypothetical protein